jgi:chromosome segregation ATPase
MDAELERLEQRIASLVAHARALRAANEDLRRELAAAREQNAAMRDRMQAAGSRLDALLARIPVDG